MKWWQWQLYVGIGLFAAMQLLTGFGNNSQNDLYAFLIGSILTATFIGLAVIGLIQGARQMIALQIIATNGCLEDALAAAIKIGMIVIPNTYEGNDPIFAAKHLGFLIMPSRSKYPVGLLAKFTESVIFARKGSECCQGDLARAADWLSNQGASYAVKFLNSMTRHPEIGKALIFLVDERRAAIQESVAHALEVLR